VSKLEAMFSDFTKIAARPGGWSKLEQKLTSYGRDLERVQLIAELDALGVLEQRYLRGAIHEALGELENARAVWRDVAVVARRRGDARVQALVQASLEQLP
jgi:hypothetical protein